MHACMKLAERAICMKRGCKPGRRAAPKDIHTRGTYKPASSGKWPPKRRCTLLCCTACRVL